LRYAFDCLSIELTCTNASLRTRELALVAQELEAACGLLLCELIDTSAV
jgi:hypothetical protein